MVLQLADAQHALKYAEERAARALAAKASYKEQSGCWATHTNKRQTRNAL